MISLDNGIYTHNQMDKILKSNRVVKYRFELLDKNEISIGNISARGSINFNAKTNIMRVASLEMNDTNLNDEDLINARIKPYMDVYTPTGYKEYPLGVFLVSNPNNSISGVTKIRKLECYDKAAILNEDKFLSRYFIPKGISYIKAITDLLEQSGIFNYEITPSLFTTSSDIEFSVGTSKLKAVNELLKAINYTPIWFDGDGYAKSGMYVSPDSRVEEYSYLTDKESITFSGINRNIDTFNVPNVIIRYTGNPERDYLISKYVNDNPSSKLSTVSRGRNIVSSASVTDVADQGTLDGLVRRLADENSLYEEINFNTITMPHHGYLDCLHIKNKELDIDGTFIESEWTMELKIGGKMKHKCRKLVYM